MQTIESTHGHELMRWLGEHGPLTREALLEGAARTFGPTTFHTCSQEGLTAAALLDFLLAKGKIAEGPEGLTLAVQPCDH
jgi:probable metal-binding protein